MALAEVTPIGTESVADIRRLLGELADECEEADVDAVATVCIVKGRVTVRGFGSNAHSTMVYTLLGLGMREVEDQWAQAGDELTRGG